MNAIKNCPTLRTTADCYTTVTGATYQRGVYERANGGKLWVTEQIARHAPYDETEYYWATRRFDYREENPWQIYRGGERVETLSQAIAYIEVMERLYALDDEKRLTRTGRIY
ncbi:hypothetical protein FACS1894208_00560 [Clostridia bacterium]|nr:hypothetical protein FACS1894208_00560 [Clostridia bacterium]